MTLERSIEIKRPGRDGALNILRYHVAGEVAESELSELASLLDGATGAEIMQCVRDARRTARRLKRALSAADLRAVALPDASLPPDEMWRICIHEAGHAVAVYVLGCGSVKRCVVNDDGTGRITQIESGSGMPTRSSIELRTVVTLSGRAAEEHVIGNACMGSGGEADSDIAFATRAICGLHASLGLGDSFVCLGAPQDLIHILRRDPQLKQTVDRHLAELYRRAEAVIAEHREAVLAVAYKLRERRYVSDQDIRGLIDRSFPSGKPPSPPDEPVPHPPPRPT